MRSETHRDKPCAVVTRKPKGLTAFSLGDLPGKGGGGSLFTTQRRLTATRGGAKEKEREREKSPRTTRVEGSTSHDRASVNTDKASTL